MENTLPGEEAARPTTEQRAADGGLTVKRFPFRPTATMAVGRPAGRRKISSRILRPLVFPNPPFAIGIFIDMAVITHKS